MRPEPVNTVPLSGTAEIATSHSIETDGLCACRVAFLFVYVSTGYVCWLLVKYYQVRCSLVPTNARLLHQAGVHQCEPGIRKYHGST